MHLMGELLSALFLDVLFFGTGVVLIRVVSLGKLRIGKSEIASPMLFFIASVVGFGFWLTLLYLLAFLMKSH